MLKINPDLFQDPLGKNKPDLFPLLKELTHSHASYCSAYKKIIDVAFPSYKKAQTLADLPYLPVSLFKHRKLRSIPKDQVRFSIQSSGTTTAQKSQVALDKETARLTARALSSILRQIIGPKRLPLLYIDSQSALSSHDGMGARAAALLGLMPFGFDHCFMLNDDLSPNQEKLDSFLNKYKGQEILIYGFTSLIWEGLKPICQTHKIDLSKATLLHSGGWKHLANQNISHTTFNEELLNLTGIKKITNFYGMAEMPGVIFPENDQGSLTIPTFSSVLIRNPHTLEIVPDGHEGLIQTFNPLAHSFPGHTLLTEDIGIKEKDTLRVIGRAPKAELRGCSDVIASI